MDVPRRTSTAPTLQVPVVRRAYGTGSLITRTDSNGREVWYGKWRSDGRQINRQIGPKRTRSRADGITKNEAERRLRALIAAHAAEPAERQRRYSAMTLQELHRRYDEDRGRKLKDRTREGYSGAMRTHIGRHFAGRGIGDVDRNDVAGFVSDLERRGLAPKTIRNHVIFLSTLYNYAIDQGWTAANPARGVTLPDPEDANSEELRFLEAWQVRDLIERVPEGQYQLVDQALYATAAGAGLRTGELLALRWESVDFDRGVIRVVRAYSGQRVGSTKGRRQRSVPLPALARFRLAGLQQQAGAVDMGSLVLADPMTGGMLAKTPRWRRWVAAKEAAGIDAAFRFHDLRHTFATLCARDGIPLTTIAQWLGHRSTSMTERYAMHAPAHLDGKVLDSVFDPRSLSGRAL